MSKFPVEVSDDEGVIDAINYLLSGPQGLGQNFKGFNSSNSAYSTGNYRPPFSQSNPAIVYVSPIALGTSSMLDTRTWKFEFATPQPTPPFAPGQPIYVNGVADPYYDGTYSPVGVAECTTTYVIARTDSEYAVVANSTGGTVSLSIINYLGSTDCNAKVTTTGATDRVFISSQLTNTITYTTNTTANLVLTLQLDRYIATPTFDPTNPDYRFIPYPTNELSVVSKKRYVFPTTPTSDGVSTFTFAGNKADLTTLTSIEASPITTTGSGQGLKVLVTLQPTTAASPPPYTVPYSGSNTTITIINPGSGYAPGDIVTIPAYQLGPSLYNSDAEQNFPVTPDNDLILTITAISAFGTRTLDELETVFSTVVDNPGPGYFWYLLDFQYDNYLDPSSGNFLEVYRDEFGLRSFSAQVVKE